MTPLATVVRRLLRAHHSSQALPLARTLRVLPELTADDLKELGVTAIGHRRLLLKAIAGLAGSAISANKAFKYIAEDRAVIGCRGRLS
jgi:hypothetical protein